MRTQPTLAPRTEQRRPIAPSDSEPVRPEAGAGVARKGLYKIDLLDDIDAAEAPPSAVDVFPMGPATTDVATYVLATQPGAVDAVLRWLLLDGSDRAETEPGVAARVALVRYDAAADPWDARYGTWAPVAIKLRPQGITTVHSERVPPERVRIGHQVCGAEVIGIRPPDVRAMLTARQQEVLEVAAAVGHYEVPRRAGVQDVASALQVGTATTSELLRRAESALVWRHLDDDMMERRSRAFETVRRAGRAL